MKIILSTNEGVVINKWENIESSYIDSKGCHYRSMPAVIGREICEQIDRAIKYMGVKLEKVTIQDDEPHEEMREV